MTALLVTLGTIACLLGFLKPPKSSWELVGPRFVIPLLFWVCTFAQPLVFQPENRWSEYYLLYHQDALKFSLACIMGFWLGYAMPIGRSAGHKLSRLGSTIYIKASWLFPLGITGLVVTFIIAVAGWGGALFSPEFGFVPPLYAGGRFGQIMAILAMMLAVLGAGCIGLSYPISKQFHPFRMFFSILLLSLGSVFLWARFSRGSGVLFVVALLAHSTRAKRLRIFLTTAVIFLAMMMLHAGMSGRPYYGHYAGLFQYAKHFTTYTIPNLDDVVLTAIYANDSLSRTAIGFHAEAQHIDVSPTWVWLINQVPVPRSLGLPTVKTDFSLAVSNRERWVTKSMIGDCYIHMGYWGFLMFAYVGAAYRFVNSLLEKQNNYDYRLTEYGYAAQPNMFGVDITLLYVALSYYAMIAGMFNNFRAWVVSFFFSLYLILAVIFVLRVFSSNAKGRA